jgi:ribose 5-phosphate isomerase A
MLRAAGRRLPAADIGGFDVDQNQLKREAAARAVQYVRPNTVVGLGTGSTSLIFLELLAKRNKEEKMNIRGVATSEKIAVQGREWGIPVAPTEEPFDDLDICVDGADEVDPTGQLVKGGGGALLREKYVALAAKRFLVIVDGSKHVPRLGHGFKLPVEIVPFGATNTMKRLKNEGLEPVIREKEGKRFITDNHNYIADCGMGPVPDVKEFARRLKLLPGVVEVGLFIDMADLVITAAEGGIKEQAFGQKRITPLPK